MRHKIAFGRDDWVCFDAGNPFPISHAGRLYSDNPESFGIDIPPVNHCVVRHEPSGELGLLRFSVFDTDTLSSRHKSIGRKSVGSLKDIADSPKEAADLHQRHLQKLGEIGLTPWYVDIRSGKAQDADGVDGVFIWQELLPLGTRPAFDSPDFYDTLFDGLDKYKRWIKKNDELYALSDIGASTQYSWLPDGRSVLHDVEPVYDYAAKAFQLL